MPIFGKTSMSRLNTCDARLKAIFIRVVGIMDCSVVEGFRDEETQNRYFDENKSKVQWPDGKHNSKPSKAVDVVPYIEGTLSWKREHCIYLAGIAMGVASMMGITLRWGGDWDMDHEPITDQDFQDLVHFEIVDN